MESTSEPSNQPKVPAPLHPHGLRSLVYWLIALIVIWSIDWFVVPQLDAYIFMIIMYAGINIILAVSLNLVNGFTGQFSMGHAGFMAVGGYVAAVTSQTLINSFMPGADSFLSNSIILIVSLLIGGFAAAIVGYIVGLPSLRLKGDYLAIVTLGFGEIIRVILLNTDAVGGARGMPGIPGLTTFGWLFTFVIITAFTIWRLVNSTLGRSLLSVREDEIAAEAVGVNTTQSKVTAFTIGAFFGGIGGGLFAHFLRFLVPSTFDFNRSFEIIIMVVLGGMGSITGSVIAAVFLTVIREALRPLQELTQTDFRMVIYSLVLIILMLTRPNGLMGHREFTAFLPKKLRRKLEGNVFVKL